MKGLFDHTPATALCGWREHKDPLGSTLMKKLRKQASPQVLTNPDSGLKSHLAHCTQNNQSNHSRSWAKGARNVSEVLSDSTLLAEPLTQHHVSDSLLVKCPRHYVSRPESRQMIRHRKLPLSRQCLSVTLHLCSQEGESPSILT